MSMHHHSITKPEAHRVQHDVGYIIVMVVQVHASMNQNYELFVTNGTRPKDIKFFSL
jgi:hypothetical protein